MSAKKFHKALYHIPLILLSVVFLIPVIVTLSNSFMSASEVYIRYSRMVLPENHFDLSYKLIHFVRMSLIPDCVSFDQYMSLLFDNPDYLNAFLNSAKLAFPIVFGQILIGVPTAYAFEFSKVEFKEPLFFIYIVVMFLPVQVSLGPNLMTTQFLGIESGSLAIIITAIFSPFPVFLFRQFLRSMPKEYIEAAKIDGAGHITIIRRIILPLFKSAVAAAAILSFTTYWNMVEQVLVFITESPEYPLSTYLPDIAAKSPGIAFAGSCFYMLPALIVFLYGRKELVSGVANSAIQADR